MVALAKHDDGSDAALYAGTAPSDSFNPVKRWNGGTSWTSLGSMPDVPDVFALLSYDDGSGLALFAGGSFGRALDSLDSHLAKWACVDPAGPVLSCPSSVSVRDGLADGLGEVVTFTVTASDDLDPVPVVACVPPSGSLFPPGTTMVTCTATDAYGNASTCAFPVNVQRLAQRKP